MNQLRTFNVISWVIKFGCSAFISLCYIKLEIFDIQQYDNGFLAVIIVILKLLMFIAWLIERDFTVEIGEIRELR